jgi:hypothetical protein
MNDFIAGVSCFTLATGAGVRAAESGSFAGSGVPPADMSARNFSNFSLYSGISHFSMIAFCSSYRGSWPFCRASSMDFLIWWKASSMLLRTSFSLDSIFSFHSGTSWRSLAFSYASSTGLKSRALYCGSTCSSSAEAALWILEMTSSTAVWTSDAIAVPSAAFSASRNFFS